MEKAFPKSEAVPDNNLADAEAAMAWEHSLTARRAWKLYPKAVGYSLFVSLLLVMEGFDTKVVGSLYAVPEFKEAFGSRNADGSYEIPAAWQSGISAINGVTAIMGMFLGGWASERFGFRKTMIGGLLSMPPIIFAFFFASGLEVYAVANFLFGFPIGIFQSVTTVYISEIMPTALRPYMTSCNSMAWAIGQLLNAGVFRGCLQLPSPWTYRVPFALQWFWPAFLIFGIWKAPESPWWLVRQNRLEEAEAVLVRITSPELDIEPAKLVSLMVFTTDHEREIESGTSYLACFKGVNLRRTIIVMGIYSMQCLTGAPLRAWMTYFFTQAGLPADQSFNMTIVALSLSIFGVIGAWVVLTYLGRRRMHLWGISISIALFTAIGAMGVEMNKSNATALGWGIGSILAVDSFMANLLILPVSFAMVTEIPSSLLRSKSVVIARNFYTVVNIFAGTITPYMINPTAWAWGAKTGFFWAGACVIGLAFTFFMVPESKGRTTAEMDILFEQKVSVRKFRTTEANLYEAEGGASA
ncbi:general substrate transporter [Sarocladium strictum]